MNKRQLLIPAILLIASLLGYGLWGTLVFRVTSVNPPIQNFAAISPYLDITFSQALVMNKSMGVTSNPAVVSGFSVTGKRLRLSLVNLQKDHAYYVAISNLTSVKGKHIDSYIIRFTARDIAFADLPKDQQKTILDAQQSNKKQVTDPILSHLPYGGLNYSLDASFSNSKLVIIAKILPSASDAKSDEQAAITVYEQQVVDYIRSLGLNPSKYTIVYQIVEPSLY